MASSNACWGIEIGAGAVKAVKVVSDGDSLKVVDFALIPHARVLSTPDIDPDDAKRVALGRLVSEHDLSKALVAVSVPGHSAFARFAKLPPVEPKKVPDIVKFEAVQQIPFPLEEVEWDYQTFVSPDSPDVEVGIFAITKQRVAAELTVLKDVNITPDVITLSPVAVYNAMANDLSMTESSPGTILLDIGTTSTDLVIAHSGRVWVRTFPIGGHEFTNALVEQFKLSYPKAEKLKREAEQSKHARHVFQALRPVFSDLVQDVQRSIGYYQSMHPDAKLERLIGMGSTFELPGLRKYLKQQLGLNVYRLENFKKLTVEGPRAAEFTAKSLNFATAYGLALQGLGESALNANLMPVAVTKEAMWAAKGKWFAAAAGLALVATGSMFIRPFLDQQATTTVEPKAIQEASRKADENTRLARDAGVTEDVSQGAKIAGLIALYQDRDTHLRLLGDVNELLSSAARAGNGNGFKLHAMHTDYLYGDVPIPIPGTQTRRQRGGSSASEMDSEFALIPSQMGSRNNERAMREGGGSSGSMDEAEATGDTGPRIAVSLELSTTRKDYPVFVEEAVERWLRQNAVRDGVPYYLKLTNDDGGLDWEKTDEIVHEAAATLDPRGRPIGQNADRGGRPGVIGRSAPGNRRSPGREGEFGENPEGVVPGLSNPRLSTGGGQPLAANAAQALSQLEQLAPLAPEDGEQHAPGTVETFLRVTFVAVLGEMPAEGEGDQ
ncbi:MAG: type IV pilus assembly protein PilM [Planctomycetota bacterium]|nr:MAG: type IV pilus assembly protein PilM [Planctomycetota bacterium]